MGVSLAKTTVENESVENPTVNLMMRQSFPELATALRGRRAQIMERFRGLVRTVLPSADELTLSELVDHLPEVLEDLAVALAAQGGTLQASFVTDSRHHGVCRYHQSFNLSELLVEYSILRSLVIEDVTKAMERSLVLVEISALNAGMDAASRRAVESFVAYHERELQATNEAHSKYLSFLSHDLRGNLNGILLTVEVLQRAKSNSSRRKELVSDLDLMRKSIMDTVSAMDRFLHADKFRRGKVEVKLGEVNLAELVRDVATQFMEQAKEKGVEIKVESDHCPTVKSDRELVQLILQNLMGNAVKYTQKGKVEISMNHAGGGRCRITVADQGPGIPKEQLDRIFEPYMRGPTHGQKGIGLGLTIAHEAAVLLKARLWAESEPGRGTKFHLELPE
jgi:signal transduction histidine kinase